MKKLFCIFCICFLVLSGCAQNNSASSTSMTLNLSDLYQTDTEFSYPGIAYEDSIAETEHKLGYSFDDIPYSSSRGERLDKNFNSSTDLFDYRNNNNFESATFLAAANGKNILVEYKDFRGHLSFEYYQGRLIAVNIFFGAEPSKVDPSADFGGVSNDVKSLYSDLYQALTHDLGTPDADRDLDDFTAHYWRRYINGSDTERSQLGLVYEESKALVTLIVNLHFPFAK